ncbi:hypothetical protein [Pedobacter cryoconitis]|uniref:Uncharacterized protein n=1 Tax=Pedobacter cryoconitis TaxID=188932 RepID=A0A7X0J4M6_9SPHI|nr:hypothetical protein [Pedobacter cryoconitis]MBB6501074.1 hypothetical protein [Pedobacter cryoconitis]
MFKFSNIQKKHAHYIADYNYPVGMDTRPTITFGISDKIFSGQSYYHQSLSLRQYTVRFFSFLLYGFRQALNQFKKWRARYDNI